MPRRQIEVALTIVLLAVIVGILVVVLLPANDLGSSDGFLRSLSEQQSWLIHATLFAALGGAVGLRLAAPRPTLLKTNWLLASVLLIVAFATASEIAQLQIDGRNAALGDWVADLIGTSLGFALAARIGPPAIDRLSNEQPADIH